MASNSWDFLMMMKKKNTCEHPLDFVADPTTPPPSEPQVRRGRGRPPGSKNKKRKPSINLQPKSAARKKRVQAVNLRIEAEAGSSDDDNVSNVICKVPRGKYKSLVGNADHHKNMQLAVNRVLCRGRFQGQEAPRSGKWRRSLASLGRR